jgi:hypothetical protein
MGKFRSKIDVQCWLDKDNAHPIPHHQLAGIKLHTEEKKLSNLD